MDYYKEALRLHKEHQGKIEVRSKVAVNTREDLSTAYTPGVAQPCLEIKEHPEEVYTYTSKGNMVAVLSDGSAVLGLGNIGASAGIPVMEGKCVLFKEFGDVDAFPICVETQDVDEIVAIGKNIAPVFGGINLEDISAPRCFEIERRLQEALDIPVFHDDQHGTAVVATAALINALKIVGKDMGKIRIAINGAGAAGTAIARMLLESGAGCVRVCDRKGIITAREEGQSNAAKLELGRLTNPENESGSLSDAVRGADVFIGVSAPRVLTQDMVRSMAKDPIIFAMANPEPEIDPVLAKEAGAAVVGTGRSDHPNQINNVLIFPGLFKGALQARARRITPEMKIAAAHALAGIVTEEELAAGIILPVATRKDVGPVIAEAVRKAWKE